MNKAILITGCSSGIGLCAAETLQKRGYQVFATARKPEDVARLKSLGLNALALDLNDSQSIKTALDTILSQTQGKLYAVFNNAGFGQTGAIADLDRDMMRQQFETNVFGPMELLVQILPIMQRQGYGRIIQNSSMLGTLAMPFYGAYNASKFALDGFSHTLRQELRGTDIHVSIIAPGPTRSHFRSNALQVFQTSLKPKLTTPNRQYQTLENYFATSDDHHPPFTVGPEVVVKDVIHALEAKCPKAYYYVGIPSKLFAWMRRLFPTYAQDWVIAKMSRLPNK